MSPILIYYKIFSAFCDQTLVSPTGTVSSPSFSTSSSYANNLNCQYDIKVSFGFGIKLSWSTFDIKGDMPNCDDDFVEIYIGCGRYSIGKYCSEYGYMPFDVYSPDNCLRIKFHSNSSVAGKGFQGYYSSINRLTGNQIAIVFYLYMYIHVITSVSVRLCHCGNATLQSEMTPRKN